MKQITLNFPDEVYAACQKAAGGASVEGYVAGLISFMMVQAMAAADAISPGIIPFDPGRKN